MENCMKKIALFFLLLFVPLTASEISEEEKWQFIHEKFVEEPIKNWTSWIAEKFKLWGPLLASTLGAYPAATAIKEARSFFNTTTEYEEKKQEFDDATIAHELAKERYAHQEALLRPQRRAAAREARANGVRTTWDYPPYQQISLQYQAEEMLLSDAHGKNILAECNLYNISSKRDAHKGNARNFFILAVVISSVSALTIHCILRYIRKKQRYNTLKNFMVNWEKYEDFIPEILYKQLSDLHEEYLNSSSEECIQKAAKVLVPRILTQLKIHRSTS